MRKLLSSLLLVSSCAGPARETPATALHWPESARPISVFAEACPVEGAQALEFWSGFGVTYLELGEGPTPPDQTYRTIVVRPGEISDLPGAVAVTERWYYPNLAMASATVKVRAGGCVAANIAHEIGHALGLDDVYDWSQRDDVMFFAVDPHDPPALETLTVSPEAEEQIR